MTLGPPSPGAIIGTLLNYRGVLATRREEFCEKPYLAPPRAPVLYVRPANTWNDAGAPITLPTGVHAIEAGASLAIVIGRTAARVPAAHALDFVAGYAIANDVCEPHASVYRPAIRQRCRDGFCVVGALTEARNVAAPDALCLRVFVNDRLAAQNTTGNLVRPVAQLIADVTEFMTLSAGDVLLSGVPEDMPLLRESDSVRIEIDGLGSLSNRVVRGAGA